MKRTPQQIMGDDLYTQLVFEGYAVVPAERMAALETALSGICSAYSVHVLGSNPMRQYRWRPITAIDSLVFAANKLLREKERE